MMSQNQRITRRLELFIFSDLQQISRSNHSAPIKLFVQTKRGPRIHQRPPFIKQISPAISGLSLIAYRMSQRHLNNFIRKICPLRRPVSKRRSKAVNRYIESHPLQHHRDRGLREGLTASELKQEILT